MTARISSVRQQLIKSFIGVGAMYALSIPLGLATSILLARMLGPQAFGQYAFVMSLLSLMALPSAGGIPQLLTREVATFAHAGDWPLYRGVVRAAHFWVLMVALIILFAYVIAGPLTGVIPGEGKLALVGIVILLVPLEGLNAARNGTIKGLGYPALAELPNQAIRPLLLIAALALLALTGQLSTRSALWAQVAVVSATFLVATILFLRIRPQEGAIQPVYRCRLWLMALLPFTMITLVGTLNSQIGIVLLGTLGTDEAVAALRVADRGAQFVVLTLGLINMVVAPHIVRIHREGNCMQLQQLSRQLARGAFSISLAICLALLLSGNSIIRFAFGEEYVDIAYKPMAIVSLGYLFTVGFGISAPLLAMSGHEKQMLAGQLAGLCAIALAGLTLIPLYHEVGAAIAIALGQVVWNGTLGFAVYRYLKIRPGIF